MSAYADLGTLWLNIGVKNKINDEFKQVENTVRQSSKVIEDLGKKFTAYLTVPLTGLGALATKEFADFEQGMSKVQATAGATAEEMVVLTAKAREMGKSTQFSASEVASAMEYMAMAGWNTEQILSGLGGVLNLAAASGEDLASVSDIVTDSLTGFGLTAEDTAKFVDVLAEASRASNTDVSMLGESFKYVAPVAGALGITAEDTAITLGLMANAGIKASQAGTSLRQSILSMVDPTKEAQKLMDEYGISIQKSDDGSVDLRATLDSLKGAMDGLENTQQAQILSTIVGTEASSGLMAVLNATEKDVSSLTNAVENSAGAAQQMAEVMNNNLKGNINKLKSAFSELLITVGENLLPIFTKIIEKVTDIINWFSSLDEETQAFIVDMGLLAAAVGPVLMTLGNITKAVTPLASLFSATSAPVAGVGTAMGGVVTAAGGLSTALGGVATFLTGPWGLAIGAGVAGIVALHTYMSQTPTMSFEDSVKNIQGLSDETAQMVIDVTGEWDNLTNDVSNYLTDMDSRTQEGMDTIIETMNTKTSNLVTLEQQKYEERKQLFDDYKTWTSAEGATFYEEVLAQDQQATEDRINELNRLNLERQNLIMNYDSMTEAEQILANARIAEINNEFAVEEIGLKARTADEILALIESKGAMKEAKQIEFAQSEIKRANEVRDAAISAADEEYEARVLAVANMKGLSQEQKEQMIRDAQDIRTETVSEANAQKREVVDALGKAYPELYKILDYNTGEMSNRWAQFGKQMVSDHEGEMHNLDIIMANSATNVGDVYTNLKKGVNKNLKDVITEEENVSKEAKKMGDQVKNAGQVSEGSIKGIEDKVDSLHKKINSLPTTKTINVIVNETTRKRTEVYGSSAPSGRAVLTQTFVDDGLVTFNDALYNMTAFNTGFNPSDDIARYDSSVQNRQQDQVISTKGIEERLEKLTELFEQFKDLKIYLDKYTLVGELAPGISREMARGVRMKW